MWQLRVRLSAYIRPICLPPPGWELTRSKAMVAGWGNTSTGFSSVAKEASLVIWGDNDMCSTQYKQYPSRFDEGLITDQNLCASKLNEDADDMQHASCPPFCKHFIFHGCFAQRLAVNKSIVFT